jgi:stage III sporulation protein AE
MRKLILILILISSTSLCVHASPLDIPTPPKDAYKLMPSETDSFAESLLFIIEEAVTAVSPDIKQAAGICLSLIAVSLVLSLTSNAHSGTKQIVGMAGVLTMSGIILSNMNGMVNEGARTVSELSEYGKLLIPIMTSAVAAQGGVTGATSISTATIIADGVLTSLISSVLVPGIYVFLALSVANSMVGHVILQKLKSAVKWIIGWMLKIVLYLFTGYMGITGVVSGTTDAAALKATKMAISGMVPVVGGLMADASESVLIGAGVLKNAAGIYGITALIAVWISPFLEIGVQYLLLKSTGALCMAIGGKQASGLIGDFSGAMGLLLAMTGTVCVLLLISTVCFMKGVG